LAKLPVFTATLRRWLQAGVVELGFFSPTDTGTPQGGVLSPLLANVALDGMERLFDADWPDGRPKTPAHRKGLHKGVTVIRYADDFVGTAPTREVLETHVRPRLEQFLHERGLACSEAKTRMVHITEGCNFLGFHIRKFGNRDTRLLTVPQKDKALKHVRAIRASLDAHKQTPAMQVIKKRNPVIRGWANYYRHASAKDVFKKVRNAQWHMLWNWAKRRHPNKGSRWVKARYFRENWLRVLRSADTSPIAQGVRQQRHTKGEPLEKCEGFSRSTGVGMRLIAMFFGPHAPREQTAQSSVFSHYFKRLERLPKLATSSIGGIFV
jgi:RNA-directed DNA polymerase